MIYSRKRALELLRIGSGQAETIFRDGQEEAIRHILEGQCRLLLIQRTGWGKSFVYFIATKLLRENGAGPALLISPLLALMRNQIAAAERMGLRAATINSENEQAWSDVEAELRDGAIDILLISPERLANERFRTEVLATIANRISLLVIDEAHCISDWGHDFRPQYRLLERTIRNLPSNIRIVATTATANYRVLEDLVTVLGPRIEVLRGDLDRPSLTLQTIRLATQAERLAWLAQYLPLIPGHGIIYTLTVRDAVMVAEWLRTQGMCVEAYTAETGDRRVELELALQNNQVKALVATTALGMGYDKPDLSFVIHYQAPGSVIAYYQQVGRAGRALESAYGILLSGTEEVDISEWFIRSAFPDPQEVHDILAALNDAPDGLTMGELLGRVNVSRNRIDKTLELLSLESPAPLAKQGNRWQLTAAELSETFWERADRLTKLRRRELRQMQDYVGLPFGDHMKYLISALDGDITNVTSPRLHPLPTVISDESLHAAVSYLRRSCIDIEPRRRWPDGGLPAFKLSGIISPNLRAEIGRALSFWGDSGWGGLVKEGKLSLGRYSDDLVAACVDMLSAWNPRPAPAWVTCVPSLRHPSLVPDFAQRLADALGLPFHRVLFKAQERPEQKSMANSIQQARNVDGALGVFDCSIPPGPVLLVDDVVASRWTLTISAWLLRTHGSGQVWPLVLAQAGHAE